MGARSTPSITDKYLWLCCRGGWVCGAQQIEGQQDAQSLGCVVKTESTNHHRLRVGNVPKADIRLRIKEHRNDAVVIEYIGLIIYEPLFGY